MPINVRLEIILSDKRIRIWFCNVLKSVTLTIKGAFRLIFVQMVIYLALLFTSSWPLCSYTWKLSYSFSIRKLHREREMPVILFVLRRTNNGKVAFVVPLTFFLLWFVILACFTVQKNNRNVDSWQNLF